MNILLFPFRKIFFYVKPETRALSIMLWILPGFALFIDNKIAAIVCGIYIMLALVAGERGSKSEKSAILFTGIYGFGLILIKFILGYF